MCIKILEVIETTDKSRFKNKKIGNIMRQYKFYKKKLLILDIDRHQNVEILGKNQNLEKF